MCRPNLVVCSILILFSFVLISCSENSTSNDTTPPTVIITSPVNNSEIVSGTITSIDAEVEDNKGIKNVVFFINNTDVFTDDSSPYSYKWDTSGLSGTYVIYTKAYDTNDNVGTSNIIMVKVKEDNIAPNHPSNPSPENYATSVPINSILSWACTDPDDDSLTYDVYFGMTSSPSIVSTDQTETAFNPGILNEDVTYYWQIIAKDNHSHSTTGDIWEFTTEAGIGYEMVFVEGGTFNMGDYYNEGWSDELPVHAVTLNDFWIGKHEVTQAVYEAVVGSNPSYFSGENHPVEKVDWFAAVRCCNYMSLHEGLTPVYSVYGNTNPDDWGLTSMPDANWDANGYRLPTEAEWEYVARGGIYWMDSLRYSGCNEDNDLGEYAWFWGNASVHTTRPVETKQPNQLDIYDMTGNVWEWCWDGYEEDYYSHSPSINPTGPEHSTYFVLRGGSWGSEPFDCRVSLRNCTTANSSYYDLGLRLVRSSIE